jgi:hypothetical protein
LVGQPPETSTAKPNKSELQEVGPFGPGNLVLQFQPFRIDWVLTPRLEDAPEKTWIGPFSEALKTVNPLMTQWLKNCPPLNRLAFGAVVFEPAQDRSIGYEKLAKCLPDVKIDPKGSRDFFFQINRPRNSGVVNGLVVNRLSKWSVSAIIPIRFLMTPESLQQQMGEGKQAVRIEVDISTAAEFSGELPQAKLPHIFEELVSLGDEIIEAGDIP